MRLALAFLAALLFATAASAQTADTVLFNGKVVTVDNNFSIPEAIAIARDRIVATGTSEAMKKLAAAHARMIDLGGRTVIPGLTDGHIHGIRAALTFGKLKPADKVTPADLPKADVMRRRGERWKPWSSVASWYLWRACDLAAGKLTPSA